MSGSSREILWPTATARRVNEKPNVQEFCKNTQALRVINCSCLGPVKDNCRGSNNKMTAADLEENQPLRKRKATIGLQRENSHNNSVHVLLLTIAL